MKSAKRILALVLAAVMVLSMVAFADNEEDETIDTVEADSDAITIETDGNTLITDSSFDDLYAEGSAAEGVEALTLAGAVTVNGTVVNGEVSINGAPALWQEDDGTWSWKTHIMYNGTGLSYDEAALAFVEGMSHLRGPSYTLTLTDGYVSAIDFIIMDGAFAETVTIGDTTTTMTICGTEGDGSMNRTNPSTVEFKNEYVEADSEGTMPSDQCLILYYQDENGDWHMRRADSQEITVIDGQLDYTDSLINLEYSQAWNRPTQPMKAINWMGLESVDMIQWFYCDGITSALSQKDGLSTLQTAVEMAEDMLVSLAVSEDGSDIPDDQLWVTQEDYDLYQGAVELAESIVSDTDQLNTVYEEEFFYLAQAYGADGGQYSKDGNVFSDGVGIINRAQYGTLNEPVLVRSVVANMGDDSTIDDSKYDDLYLADSAEDGIKDIIAAGECYINDFAFPATSEEAADGYYVNQTLWFQGGSYDTEDDYLDAAFTSVLNKGNNPSMPAAGNEYLLYDTNGDGYVDQIKMLYKEGLIVADYTVNDVNGTVSIERGDIPEEYADIATGTEDGRLFDGDHFAAGAEGYEVKIENFDETINAGDVVLFSYTPDGWVIERCIEVTGLFTYGEDHDCYEIDGVRYEDAMMFSRDNIIISNRNGEFTNAQKYFGFMNNDEGLTVTLWIAPTHGDTVGAPVGMTTNGNSDIYLSRAIAAAQVYLDTVVASDDGAGLSIGTQYVSIALYDQLQKIVDEATEILNSDCYASVKDFEVYRLYLCLNGTGDDIGAAFGGFSYGDGFVKQIQTVLNGFEEVDGVWYYFENGEIATDLNSVVAGTIDGTTGLWYVLDGAAQLDFTGLCDYAAEDGNWYYVTNGLVDSDCNSVEQNSYGWWYVVDGQVQFNFTGLAEYGNEYGWWYIENGKVNFDHNCVDQNSNGWWYVVGSQVQFDFTGLAEYSNEYGWWYIENGKVNFNHNCVDQNSNGWWYVVGSQVQFGYTGVADYANEYGWWYIEDGKVNFDKTSIEQNVYGWWRVVDSKVDFSCNSVEQNDYGWWYVVGGQVDFSYTGVANYANAYGWWYIENGKVDFDFTGNASNIYGTWLVVNGKVLFD